MTPKFEFYEKVKVCSDDPQKSEVRGELGAIVGRVQRESGDWYYAVHVYKTSEGWDFYESELEATGEFDVRETFYDGETVRVAVDERGHGRLKDKDPEEPH